ncbi:MAG: ATP-binding cassette domain-containing protein [Acidobacteriota bacterium]
MISVQKLEKRYGPTYAVRGISFEVNRGEIVGFLGPNGAGKTTTMKVLTGFLVADGGKAEVAGLDVRDRSLEVRRRIGYLPENAPLYLDMTVLDTLRFMASVRRIPRSARKAKIDRAIQRCGLSAVVHKPAGKCSKGYRQRLGLAQALVHEPEILILDEPTSGLDPNQIVEIRNLIKEIGREKTVILSTHILPEVKATCSRAIIIHEGAIVANAGLAELESTAAKGNSLTVTFKGAATDMEHRLRAIAGVTHVRRESDAPEARFQVRGEAGKDLREDIFALAKASDQVLLEMTRASAGLEDVFRRLTGKGTHAE